MLSFTGFYRKDHLRKHTRSHVARRAREELVAQQQQQQIQQPPQNSPQSGPLSTNDSKIQTTSTATLLSNIQPEITIHVKKGNFHLIY